MQKPNLTQQKYTENAANIQLVMPINFEVLIPENDSVRLLSQIVEELDFTDLKMAYSSKGRNPEIPPRILFQVLVYAYMNSIYSSRKIETACKRDINFMWLLEGHPAPDHNTISRFRTLRLANCMEKLFNQLVAKLSELGEIQFKNLFVDGTKIESAANKYSFVWKKAVNKNEAKLAVNAEKLINEINAAYHTEFIAADHLAETLSLIDDYLTKEKERQGVTFVSGIGKRKSPLQRYAEKISDYLKRQQKYEEYNELFQGRNSFSKTDTDATFMHMKEDHMRNSQLKPGYNIQIGVEGGYVVGIDVSSERSDQLAFVPFLAKLEKNLPQKFRNVTADAGYESEENYLYLKKHKQRAFIKPQIYEQWKKRSFKNLIGKRENMTYLKEDAYLCNQGRKLKNIGTSARTSKSGYKSELTVYECESCQDCPVKSKCTKAKENRKVEASKKFLKLRERSWKNIMTPKGILLRMNRSIQVEGAFGVMKEDYGFRRFLTRGKRNVGIEYLLLSFGFNINKLHQKIQTERTGLLLYEKEVA